MVSFKKAFLTDNKRFNSFATTTKQYETESFNDLTVTILKKRIEIYPDGAQLNGIQAEKTRRQMSVRQFMSSLIMDWMLLNFPEIECI